MRARGQTDFLSDDMRAVPDDVECVCACCRDQTGGGVEVVGWRPGRVAGASCKVWSPSPAPPPTPEPGGLAGILVGAWKSRVGEVCVSVCECLLDNTHRQTHFLSRRRG